MNEIIIISALDEDFGIGKSGKIPWHISEDFKLFKGFTNGQVVIMGRKTWESLPFRPLPNRVNIVISSNIENIEGNCIKVNSLEEGLEIGESYDKNIFIIGGSRVYFESLKFADLLYLSHVKGSFECDTFFPKFNKNYWKVVEEKEFSDFVFRKYKK